MISQLVSLDERAGTNVSSYSDIDDVLDASSLNFNVETVPAHTPEGSEVPGVNLIRREDTGHILGTCGSRYNVIDNRDMFKPFASVVENHGATYESAGTVGEAASIGSALDCPRTCPSRWARTRTCTSSVW